MLASAYFEKMLTPRWQEGQELGANGSMELNITDTDPNGTSSQTNLKLLGESTKQEIEKAISVLQCLDLS